VFTDNMVLQRGASTHAAVYGAAYGVSADTTVTVTVTDAAGQPVVYKATIVDRATDPVTKVANMTWRVLLAPHDYGGNATVSAACANCKNTTPAVISNVMWGDVWICEPHAIRSTPHPLHIIHPMPHFLSLILLPTPHHLSMVFACLPSMSRYLTTCATSHVLLASRLALHLVHVTGEAGRL
jgi:hypothetical protein